MITYAKNEVNFSRMPLHKKRDWDFYTNSKHVRNRVLTLAFKFLILSIRLKIFKRDSFFEMRNVEIMDWSRT